MQKDAAVDAGSSDGGEQMQPSSGFLVYENAKPYVALSNGMPVGIRGDDAAQWVDIGFPFFYDGQQFLKVAVSTNALLSFDALLTDHENYDPLEAPPTFGNVLAPWWDDFEVAQENDVQYALLGSAPHRTFVVEWKNLKHRPYVDGASGTMVTDNFTREVQVRLYEGTNQIAFHYGKSTWMYVPGPVPSVDTATVGLFAAPGSVRHFTIKMCTPSCQEGPLGPGVFDGNFQQDTEFLIAPDVKPAPTWEFLYEAYFKTGQSAGHCGNCHLDLSLGRDDFYEALFNLSSINLPDPNTPGYPPYKPPIQYEIELFVRLPDKRPDRRSPFIMPRKTTSSWMTEPKGGFGGDEGNMPFDVYEARGRTHDLALGNDEAKSRIKRWLWAGAEKSVMPR